MYFGRQTFKGCKSAFGAGLEKGCVSYTCCSNNMKELQVTTKYHFVYWTDLTTVPFYKIRSEFNLLCLCACHFVIWSRLYNHFGSVTLQRPSSFFPAICRAFIVLTDMERIQALCVLLNVSDVALD